jgi:signal transduction histidine kinase
MIADGLAHGISTPLMSIRLAASRIVTTIDKLSAEGVDTVELSMIADVLEQSGRSMDTIMTGVRNIDKSLRKFGSSDASDAGLIFEMVTNMVAMKMEPLDIKFEYSSDQAASGAKVKLPGAFARVALALFDDAMLSMESVDGGKKIRAELSLSEDRLEVSITATADDEAASPNGVWTQHLKDAHAMAKPSEFIVNMDMVDRKKTLRLIAQVA